MEIRADDFKIDQLKEIINIGASHASTALSQMVKKKVDLSVPKSYVSTVEKLSTLIKVPGAEVTAAILKIFGDANGVMFFMFAEGADKKLAKMLTQHINNEKEAEALMGSAIQEIGNVLAGAALSAFSKFLDLSLIHSISNVATDTVDAIVNSIAAEVGKNAGAALAFEVQLTIKDENISTHFYFFFDPAASIKLLQAVEKKYM